MVSVTEGGFDPPTYGLWAHRNSSLLSCFFAFLQKANCLQGVGIEPTRISPADLKPAALTISAILAEAFAYIIVVNAL